MVYANDKGKAQRCENCEVESEQVSRGKDRSSTGNESSGRHLSSVVDGSSSKSLDSSSVGISVDTGRKFVVLLDEVDLTSTNTLDFLENNPLDSFSAGRVSPRSIVSIEILFVEAVHETSESNISQGSHLSLSVDNRGRGLSSKDRSNPGVISSSHA